MGGLLRSVALDLPITLAGAKADPGRDDLPAMLRLADRLRAEGSTDVRALRFVPPATKAFGLFHGKLVCGQVGYLGSANLTGSGLGEHVEAGIPLDPIDVDHIWWLIDVLVDGGLLLQESIGFTLSQAVPANPRCPERVSNRGPDSADLTPQTAPGSAEGSRTPRPPCPGHEPHPGVASRRGQDGRWRSARSPRTVADRGMRPGYAYVRRCSPPPRSGARRTARSSRRLAAVTSDGLKVVELESVAEDLVSARTQELAEGAKFSRGRLFRVHGRMER